MKMGKYHEDLEREWSIDLDFSRLRKKRFSVLSQLFSFLLINIRTAVALLDGRRLFWLGFWCGGGCQALLIITAQIVFGGN